MQRFKAVEAASAPDGNWTLAARYELIPASRISAVPIQEREAAMTQEFRERKLNALLNPKRKEYCREEAGAMGGGRHHHPEGQPSEESKTERQEP